jgi:integrase/recombinase XerD
VIGATEGMPPAEGTKHGSALVIGEHRSLSIDERGQELARLFGFNHLILSRRLNPDSLRVYCRDFYAYLVFAGSVSLALMPATLARWMTHLSDEATLSPQTGRPYSPNTINRMATSVRRIMREAGLQGYLDPEDVKGFHAIEGASRKALKGRLRPHNRVKITREQMREIADLAKTEADRLVGLRNWALLLTLSTSGLRVEPLRTLTREQLVYRVHQQRHVLLVRSKNETEPRDVPLSPEAYAAIDQWLAARPVDSPYLFTRFDGRGDGGRVRASCQPLSAFAVRKVVKRAAEAVGIAHVKPHDIRRFVGTVVAKLHGYKQAQQVLGHQDAATTLNNYVLEEPEPGVTDSLF